MAKQTDLTGQTFGELTVLERLPPQGQNRGVRWRCRCRCGAECETLGSLLRTGRKRHCGGSAHPKNYARADISGQRFGSLTALEATERRDSKGNVIWCCRCDCGAETMISYNELMYTNVCSCGCRKKTHSQKLHSFLTHVDGTSLDMLRSSKTPKDNTTGCRGVYFIRGKYVAKIVFQKKPYYLGSFDDMEEAAQARKQAEDILFTGTAEFYRRWKERADADPGWAAENPVKIEVISGSDRELSVRYLPECV